MSFTSDVWQISYLQLEAEATGWSLIDDSGKPVETDYRPKWPRHLWPDVPPERIDDAMERIRYANTNVRRHEEFHVEIWKVYWKEFVRWVNIFEDMKFCTKEEATCWHNVMKQVREELMSRAVHENEVFDWISYQDYKNVQSSKNKVNNNMRKTREMIKECEDKHHTKIPGTNIP